MEKKPREAAPRRKIVSFQDHIDRRAPDSSEKRFWRMLASMRVHLWREIFQGRHFYFLLSFEGKKKNWEKMSSLFILRSP